MNKFDLFVSSFFTGALDSNISNNVTRYSQESMKLARTFFLLFMTFTICWTPFALLTFLDYSNKAPQEVDMFLVIFAHSNSSINVFLYGLSNNHFRAGYVKFLHLDRCFPSSKSLDNNFDGTLQLNFRNIQKNDKTGRI